MKSDIARPYPITPPPLREEERNVIKDLLSSGKIKIENKNNKLKSTRNS